MVNLDEVLEGLQPHTRLASGMSRIGFGNLPFNFGNSENKEQNIFQNDANTRYTAPMRRLILPLIALLLVLGIASACGKRGDLETPPSPSGFQAS